MEVDNAIIEVSGVELPILDGSALPWVEAIIEAGVQPQDELIVWRELAEAVVVESGVSFYSATPAESFTLTVVTEFDHPMLGTKMTSHWPDTARFIQSVAPARTFGFQHEIEALRAAGLGLGGTLDNALIVQDDSFSQPLRMPDECHVHKLLDVSGDLALCGSWVKAAVVAFRPGHRGNVALASALHAAINQTTKA
jgi:UDP-3-O-[3-hydroxymyristoyl] N-acetylglucosamine deacetylase